MSLSFFFLLTRLPLLSIFLLLHIDNPPFPTSHALPYATPATNAILTGKGLLAAQPALTSTLAAAKDITILAPSNDAFTKFLAVPANKMASMDTATVTALLQYHVLGQLVPGSAFTTSAQVGSFLLLMIEI